MITYAATYLGTTLVSMLLVPVVSQWAKRHRLVDEPGPRKVHQTPIPRVGGIAFFLATLVCVGAVFFIDNHVGRSFRTTGTQLVVLLVAASFVFFVGLVDDLRSVRGFSKLLCLIGASLAICASGATLSSFSLGGWFEFRTGWAAWPLTVIWITAITVCMNLIDGLDGLAAGIAAIVCAAVAFMAFLTGQIAMAVLMLALMGGVTGFLFFNFYPAKIFMGDCGSMFLGFVIGAGSVVYQAKASTAVGLAIPFLAMGVPILDTGFAMLRRRVVERRSMFAADRKHLHHRLLDLGLHQRTVVIVIYAVTASCASMGVFMLTAESGWSVGFLAMGLLLLFSLFACTQGKRFGEMVVSLKRNRAISYESRRVRHCFEKTQVRMQNATSLGKWWETLCEMGGQMHFENMALWQCCDGHYVRRLVWDAPDGEFTGSRTIEMTLPLPKDDAGGWELRARIWVNGFLEIAGQQATLLARMMDEFPPAGAGEHEKDPIRVPQRRAGWLSTREEGGYYDARKHAEFGKPGAYPRTA